MIFQIVSVVVPLVVFSGAYYGLERFGKDPKPYVWLLWMACLLFFVSWYLPSPLIDGKDTAFVTHFLGGGVFSGLVGLYLKLSTGWRAHWVVEGVWLFALVSALGVLNELFELLLYVLGGMPEGIGDTSWDLLANTLGAFTVWLVWLVTKRLLRSI